MNHPGVLLLPLDRMLVHRRVTPQQYVAGTHLYTWVKRDKVEKSSLSKETTWLVRLESRNSRSGVRGVNHSATHAFNFVFLSEEEKRGSAWITSNLGGRHKENFWTSQSYSLSSNCLLFLAWASIYLQMDDYNQAFCSKYTLASVRIYVLATCFACSTKIALQGDHICGL